MYGEFTLIESAGRVETVRRLYVGDTEGRDEAWLRDLVIEHPETLPIRDIDPTFGPLVPLCSEMRTDAGLIDAVFINEHGRLTIVECKLWKNPQARREVVGQILDYVSALSSWSYADLQRQVAAASGKPGNVPFAETKSRTGNGLREPQFIDAVGKSLREGRILALIVGDGIRDEVQRLAGTINRSATKAFTLGLVEVALYETAAKQLLVQPRVLAKTEIITRELVLISGPSGEPIGLRDTAEQEERAAYQDAASGGKQHLKNWWKPVLEMTFDDPEQEPAFWVGSNNVVLNTPFPGVQIKAYARVGVPQMEVYVFANQEAGTGNRFKRLLSRGTAIGDYIRRDRGTLASELPPETLIDPYASWAIRTSEHGIEGDDARRAWIIATLNTYVNVLRPRLHRWYAEANAK